MGKEDLKIFFTARPRGDNKEHSSLVMAHIHDVGFQVKGLGKKVFVNSTDPSKAIGYFEIAEGADPDAVIRAVQTALAKNGWSFHHEVSTMGDQASSPRSEPDA